MGVTQLWQILSPVQEHQTLASLKGLVLAVDLSIWVCESDGVKNMQGVVTKPHLRNLFFRILHLIQLGVKLVFVIEGAAPELKWDTMAKRQQNRYPGRQNKQAATQKPPSKQSRKNFNSILKECCELLDILGIPYIQSKGEAEAMCALLNASGLVDGCLTDDGDAFLYGAKTVYRNFTMNAKDPHVECYRAEDIESRLSIDRHGLVALALLLGCDFVPKGVPGIGMANAVKLMDCLRGRNVLDRFQEWRKIHESQCLDPVEKMVRKKALNLSEFPQMEVINEFLHPKDRCPSSLSPWKRPLPSKFQEFALQKLDWPVEYTLEKILPLVTLWDMQDVLQSNNPSNRKHLQPHRIVKTRVRQGVPCYEIEWYKPVTDQYHEGDYYVTIENQEMFAECYPAVVRVFHGETNSKTKKKKAKKKKAKEKTNNQTDADPNSVDNLSFNFGRLNIKAVTNKLQESIHELKPSFTEYEGSALTTKLKQSSISQTSHQNVQNSRENMANFSSKGDVELTPVWSNCDSSDIPLSERIKLRLQNKQQQQLKQTDSVDAISKRIGDLSLNNVQTSGKRKKKKRKSERMNVNLDNSLCSDGVRNVRNSTISSPVSPFICENMQSLRNIRMDNTRKMSSPSSNNTFCSPVSYIKQSIQDNPSSVFKDSPIQNTSLFEETSQQKRTSTNFRFFDTPTKDVSHDTASKAQSTNSIPKPTASSILKGEWQTEFIESHIQELSKDFFVSADGILKHNKLNEHVQNGVHNTNVTKVLNDTNMNGTQEINFKLQSSLLDSLCASLIQTLTPKGLNKEQYDSLCASLKKLEQDGTDLNDLQDIANTIDFSDLEELTASFHLPNKSSANLKPSAMSGSVNKQKSSEVKGKDTNSDSANGLGKSARKRLRKKQKGILSTDQNKDERTVIGKTNPSSKVNNRNQDSRSSQSNKDIVNVSVVDMEYFGNNTQKCSSNGAKTSNNISHVSDRQSAKSTVSLSQKQTNNFLNQEKLNENKHLMNSKSAIEATVIDAQKKKKKNKKKKAKKAFTEMDLSADTSELSEFQFQVCSQYLKKALEKKPKMGKIEKASPVMDLSVDETFLELDVLSGSLANSVAVNNTEAKRKLALKKLSKRPRDTESVDEPKNVKLDVEPLHSPVMSLNAVLSSATGHTSHKEQSRSFCASVNQEQNIDNRPSIKSNEEAIKQECKITKVVCSKSKLDPTHRRKISNRVHDEPESYSRYDRDFLDAMEDVMSRASPALLSPRSPGKTCVMKSPDKVCGRARRRISDNELSPNEAVREKCKLKRSPPYCRMNQGLVSSEMGVTDAYERSIQSCKDLKSWSVLPKKISKEFLRKSQMMDCRLNARYRLENPEIFASAAQMYCSMSEQDVRNLGMEMEKINSELEATNNPKTSESDSDFDSPKTKINTGRDVTCCRRIRDEHEWNYINKESKTIDTEVDQPCETISDYDLRAAKQLYDAVSKTENSIHENDGEASSSVVEEKDSVNGEVSVINIDGDTKMTAEAQNEDNSKQGTKAGESNTSDEGEPEYSSCTEEMVNDTVPETENMESNYAEDIINDTTQPETEITESNNTEVNDTEHDDAPSENTNNSNADNFPAEQDVIDASVAETPPEVTNGDITNSAIVNSNISYGAEHCSDLDETDNLPEIINGDVINSKSVIKNNSNFVDSYVDFDMSDMSLLGQKYPVALKKDTGIIPEVEGSSDKENEQVVDNEKVLDTAEAANNTNDIPGAESATSAKFPIANSVEACSPAPEKVASPIPLLDRLKMKFKKSSARNVLHTFTNGR